MVSEGIQFVKDSPVIPVELLERLEDGGLTIFAGAGVSRCLNLPDFCGLVTQVSTSLGREMQPDEEDLFNRGSLDAVLGVIERRIPEGALRNAVRKVLSVPDGADLATHAALIKLATSKQGRLRMVTTNFDDAFWRVPATDRRSIDYAPYLPVPGGEWNSIVHLHGGLGNPADPEGRQLVLTSADFGRAYLTEGWASRFLGELFRRSAAILFVGYSVSDPAIRYIVDAFAADRDQGGSRIAAAYILVAADDHMPAERTWKSRGVEPIVYDPRENHRLLHETLRYCGARRGVGLFDRISIVRDFGPKSPLGRLDGEAVSQVTWALKEPTGHIARRFSELDPAAPVAWLPVFQERGVFSLKAAGSFSSPAVAPIAQAHFAPPLHRAIEGLCGWFSKHLESPDFIAWVIANGCHLHPHLADHIRRRLADQALPPLPGGPRRLWRFWAAPTPAVYDRFVEQQVWQEWKFSKTGMPDALLRDCVRSWFAPTVHFKAPFRFQLDGKEIDTEKVRSYAGIEILPAAGQVCEDLLKQLITRDDRAHVVPELLPDFTGFLYRALNYLEYFEIASGDVDGTYSVRPSIDNHGQNAHREKWAIYIRALKIIWELTAEIDPGRARDEVRIWGRLGFPVFRRFVVWSAGKAGGMSADEVAHFVCEQPPSTLWGIDTRRELLQCLRSVARQMSPEASEALIEKILAGPSREQFPAGISDEDFEEARDRLIHIRLAKFQQGGGRLVDRAEREWREILVRHPGWTRETNERDEFVGWLGGFFARPVEVEVLPLVDWYTEKSDAEIAAAISGASEGEAVRLWRGLGGADLSRALAVLESLIEQGYGDPAFWSLALGTLADSDRLAAIRFLAAALPRMDHGVLTANLQQLASMVNTYFREPNRDGEEDVWRIWDFVIVAAIGSGQPEYDDPAAAARSSPIGDLAEALLIKVAEIEPMTYDRIPQEFRTRLEDLLNGPLAGHRLARVVLARAVAWLHQLQAGLVEPAFLARFDWTRSDEARSLWTGYLMNPQVTPGFWPSFRPLFLGAFPRSDELGEFAEGQLYELLAWLLLRPEYELGAAEARQALSLGSPKGRARVAWFWWRQSDSATEYGANLFRERLKYLLESVWPLDRDLRDEESSALLAEIATCCSSSFPDAVATVIPLISPVRDAHDVIWALKNKDVVDRFPAETLALLSAILGESIQPWDAEFLRELLDRISRGDGRLANSPEFHRMNEMMRPFE
jgi:hypothetical protein